MDNKKYCFIAPRRSGHHAIMNWFQNQFNSEGYFLNDTDHAWGRPIRFPQIKDGTLHFLNNDYQNESIEIGYKNLFYNFEDRPISQLSNFQNELEENTKNIIILRDPFNLIASRMKHWVEHQPQLLQNGINIWVEYAQEILNETTLIPNKYVIIYNEWFQNKSYREMISNDLGEKFDDSNMIEVPEFGRGSSFDGMELNGEASSMKVLERYKTIPNKEFLKELYENEFFQRYTKNIFREEILHQVKIYLNE